ncbi:hypothetical protein Shyd_12380 [Streptomyces hydrogenans]|uniref:Uncharacterized protein n=1 Tax=Streptomyces hydrogenans TaxID=1873719 RepID=A0ABQ3P4C7_9ACTN|nr:hypothetical protein GCM10018784_11890 [Streptomyces hydrogenans]GHI19867.1 hypothetical protein Shyd_12380 [Streptomyces hydrogenans]
MAAQGVEPPLQLVAFHDQRARDQAVPLAQGRVAGVDQEGRARLVLLVRGAGVDPVETGPDPLQQFVDADALAAHCQSSGRSTCSRRSTAPVRLKRRISGSGG